MGSGVKQASAGRSDEQAAGDVEGGAVYRGRIWGGHFHKDDLAPDFTGIEGMGVKSVY